MKQTTTIVLAILLGSVIIAGGVYFGLTQSDTIKLKKSSLPPAQTSQQPTKAPVATIAVTQAPSISPTKTASPTPKEITWTKSDLIKALSQKTGIAEDKVKFSVGDQVKQPDKILIRGTVSEEGYMGGAGFFAVADQNGVTVTYAGQGVPDCSEVNPYGYPTNWANYCIDAQNNTVKR